MASPSKLCIQNSISVFRLSNPRPNAPTVIGDGSQVVEYTLVAVFRWSYNQG